MPVVTIDMFEGRTAEEKRALYKRLTEAFTETLGVPGEAVHIVLREDSRENFANNGKSYGER